MPLPGRRAALRRGGNMKEFMRHTGELWRCGNLYRTARYEALGIGSYQDSYIVNVCAHPGITQEGLCKLIFVHKSNVARQLGSLEEKGFIRRETDPSDKRNMLVYPTEKAYGALKEIKRITDEWISLVLDGFSEADTAAMEEYSARLAENARKIIEREDKKTEDRG